MTAPTIRPFLLFCLAACAASAQAESLTGSWYWNGPAQSGGYLRTIQVKDKLQFQLEVQRGAPSYNSGFIEGEFALQGAQGVFRPEALPDCEIAFDFRKSMVVLSTAAGKNECGFGYGVSADGSYYLRNRKRPKFSAGDPRQR